MPSVSVPMRPRALPFASDAPIPGLRRKAVLGSLLIQVVIGAFVLSQVNRLPLGATDDTPLQVEWIPATPVRPPVSPPPPSTPKPALPAPQPRTPVASEPVAEVAPSAPMEPVARPRLQNQISAWAQPTAPTPSPRTERWRGQPLPRLPGREEAFVEGIHTRDRPSPQQRVQAIAGMLLGARPYDCDDVARKMRSDISAAERQRLIEDERRMCAPGR